MPHIQVVIVEGPGVGRGFLLERAVSIGRADEADFTLGDLSASRLHCRLTLDANGAPRVQDLDSANGTLVNGRPCDSAILCDGDTVRIGRTTLKIVAPDFPRPAAAPDAAAAPVRLSEPPDPDPRPDPESNRSSADPTAAPTQAPTVVLRNKPVFGAPTRKPRRPSRIALLGLDFGVLLAWQRAVIIAGLVVLAAAIAWAVYASFGVAPTSEGAPVPNAARPIPVERPFNRAAPDEPAIPD